MLLITLVPLLILAFASYRITRFLVLDDLPEGLRAKFHSFLTNREAKNGRLKIVWQKLYLLTSCTFCTGFWVTGSLYALYSWGKFGDNWGAHFINLFAITGVQALLHSWEGGED